MISMNSENKFLSCIVFAGFCALTCLASAQGIINNGAKIIIGNGSYINGGSFLNRTGGADGTVDIDGTFIVRGNWTNNAAVSNVFVNIEPSPDGIVVFNNTSDQNIAGTTATHFENLRLSNGKKILQSTNDEVNGTLYLDAILDLNKNKLIIDNDHPTSINYTSGYIKSESLPSDGLGELQWNIGEAVNTFQVPFGSGAGGRDLNIIYKTNTAGSPALGFVTFATYPADANSSPLPSGVSSLDGLDPKYVADRFWKIEPLYSVKPEIDITLKYTSADVDAGNNPGIDETALKLIRYNNDLSRWIDAGPFGTDNPAMKTVTATGIAAADFFPDWTLYSHSLVPNAFTPDGDGINDFFAKGFDLKIINQWGQELYSGPDGWDGTFKGKQVSSGTYYYIITEHDENNNTTTLKGSVLLIR
jgi:gliding motility-associated-like protein